VGDWTARVGDPSGRDESRTMLTPDEVQRNAETYMQQFFIVVDRSRTEVRYQSEWYDKFNLVDVFNLTSRFTMAQMMAHETFRLRWERNQPLTLMELMYPLMQAYDSVACQADVEFGGMDQKFNNLVGRELQPTFGQPSQDVLLVPLLPGTDGRKMSKSFGNTIDLTEPPDPMYGKAMSISDVMLDTYLTLASEIPDADVEEMRRALAQNAVNPRDVKMRLAFDIVRQFHGPEAARNAQAEFVRIFQQHELPTEMPIYEVLSAEPVSILELLLGAGLAGSNSEARRLVSQGGVRLDDQKVNDIAARITVHDGTILRVGKRNFVRLVRR